MRRRKSVVTSRPGLVRTPRPAASRPRARPGKGPTTPASLAGAGAARPSPGTPDATADRSPSPGGLPAPAREPDLAVDIGPDRPIGLRLSVPLLVAAGVAGYGLELAEATDLARIGAVCTRGTTLRPDHGSPPPRMTEAPGGLLSAVGRHNPGIDHVLERFAPRWAAWPVPVIVNLWADSARAFATLAHKLDGEAGVAAVELDLASAGAGPRRAPLGLDPAAAARVTAAVRGATDLPVIVKLPPHAADPGAVAAAAEEAGADAICATGALPAMAFDPRTGRPRLGAGVGGLSGPALRPAALRVVHEVARAVRVPVVGCGGVATLDDVLEHLAAGASAVAVGSAALSDPELPGRLAEELAAWCAERGLWSHRDLVGAVGAGPTAARGGTRSAAKGRLSPSS
jgi:dihydroorotate dehydrogenase (NAD+) catalytic subunit